MKARAYSYLLDTILTVVLIVISILTIIVCTGYVFDLSLRSCAAAPEACSDFGFHSSMILTFWGGIAVVGVTGVKARLRASNSIYGWWLLLIGIAGAIGLGAIGVALVKLTM